MRELATEIEFDGTPDEVWAVLADLPAHAEWNPFITTFEGELRHGAKLEVRLQPDGGRAMTLRPTVVAVEPPHELRWLGHLLVPGIFDGEHRFRIEEAGPGRVRFVQGERFGGVLVPLLWRRLEGGTTRGFHAMNEAMARRVAERRRQSTAS
ncbi:MAG TPA: SRPBCC domain-containing protein [Actinomycetota bacterium]|nr:SRPBCC domain-containing protein [Actinomycetota bacterium]